MKHRSNALAVLVASATTLASCGLFGADTSRLATAEELVTQVERVHIESELTKEKTQVAIDALRFLVNRDYGAHGNAIGTYDNFVKAIELSERQSEILVETVTVLKDSAAPAFEQWAADLTIYSNPQMRESSASRMSVTKGRYDDLVLAVDPAIEASRVFHLGMRDHALFFGHDFNPMSVTMVQDETASLMSLAGELDVRYDACLVAARAYFETRSLPSNPRPTNTMQPVREQGMPRRGDRQSTARPPGGF